MSAGDRSGGRGVQPELAELVALRGRVAALSAGAAAGAAYAGSHPSAQRGRGMAFAELRAYQSGDDVRTIDWRHTARRGRPFTKCFEAERARPVQLLVDMGASMRFGTRAAFKSVAAARAAALLAWAVVAAGDRVGGLVSDGAHHTGLPPRGRDAGANALIRALVAAAAASPCAGSLSVPLAGLARALPAGALCVLVSDFHGLDEATEAELRRIAPRAGIAFVHIHDPLEAAAPPPGRYRIADGAGAVTVDLAMPGARDAWTAPFRAREAALRRLAARHSAPLVTLATDTDPARALALLSRPAARRAAP